MSTQTRARPARRKAKPRATGVQLGEDVARNKILFGAVQVFAVHGFRPVAVEDLLEAGQVSRRTFYRFFRSKEDVGVALYQFGTSFLLSACRREVALERDLVAQLERCVDVHLRNVRERGRLMFVLGGEAHHQDSPLFPYRMDVHNELVSIFRQQSGTRVDPLLLRTLVLALEALVRTLLCEGDEGRRVEPEAIERARRVMRRVVSASLLGEGESVAPLPLEAEPAGDR